MSEKFPPPDGFDVPPPAPPAPAYGAPAMYGADAGHVGTVRSTGVCILLFVVTLGFYGWYWFYRVHEDMKRHAGKGLGGGLALVFLVVGVFIGVTSVVLPFLTSNEVGEMQERAGRPKTVSALTALWYFPGIFILVGPIIWFVKTNGALNDYWRSRGAVG
jgi:hypothetical protein